MYRRRSKNQQGSRSVSARDAARCRTKHGGLRSCAARMRRLVGQVGRVASRRNDRKIEYALLFGASERDARDGRPKKPDTELVVLIAAVDGRRQVD